MKKYWLIAVGITFYQLAYSQGIINATLGSGQEVEGCGSHLLIQNIDAKSPGFEMASDLLLQRTQEIVEHQTNKTTTNDVVTIPVVFHVVYNEAEENLPDSVLHNQIKILNENFRRKTADTVSMRASFKGLVGDSKIRFDLAEWDPSGNKTSGIVRKQSPVQYFGGVLPYSTSEPTKIQQWVQDSLYLNMFRLTQDSSGGSTAWDPNYYLNVWIGDLRIFEPKVNNFEEVLFFALATPPVGHANWPTLPYDILENQGVLIHYVNVGSNNPVKFPAPYHPYNPLVTGGKILVHEIGHYLGLRHTWGDGLCADDDYVKDTPRDNNSAGFQCDITKNSCLDTINGLDLPDMVENYMDYASSDCQNSFTKGQIAIMREVLTTHRKKLLLNVQENTLQQNITLYPNPNNGAFTIILEEQIELYDLKAFALNGSEVPMSFKEENEHISIRLSAKAGMYFIQLSSGQGNAVIKVIVE